MTPNDPKQTTRIFVSYAREDTRWFNRDDTHNLIPWLADSLRRHNTVLWYDKELVPSDVFTSRIENEIDASHIAILIVSQSFLNSEFIEQHELPRIKERADKGLLHVVPILVEPCSWEEDVFLSARQMLPGKPTPLIDYTDSPAAWARVRFEVLDGIKKLVSRVNLAVAPPPTPVSVTGADVTRGGAPGDPVLDTARQVEVGQLAPKHARTTDKGVSHIQGQQQVRRLSIALGPDVEIALVWVPPGQFLMGSPLSEEGRYGDFEQVPHSVTIEKGFWIGACPVTQRQWHYVMGQNPSMFVAAGVDAPVEQVSWNDCVTFTKKISIKGTSYRGTGAFRLPTEAEWEYAARAGSSHRFWPGDGDVNLAQAGWFQGNSGGTTHAVGQKQPNAWGLLDVHGNVWEWCEGNLEASQQMFGPDTRLARGGSWFNDASTCRVAARGRFPAATGTKLVGMRLVMEGT